MKSLYQTLREKLLEEKIKDNDLERTIIEIEKKPDSTPRQDVLKEELKEAAFNETDSVVALAKELLTFLNKKGHMSNERYQAILQGSGAIAQGAGSIAVGAEGTATTGDNSSVTVVGPQDFHSVCLSNKETNALICGGFFPPSSHLIRVLSGALTLE